MTILLSQLRENAKQEIEELKKHPGEKYQPSRCNNTLNISNIDIIL